MLNENELAAWYERLNFSEPARTVIDRVRCSDPARRVGGGCSNVSGLYPSRKMGVTIQFESHRVELAAIYEMEHDPQTLEFYDQPQAITLDYNSASGRRLPPVSLETHETRPQSLRRRNALSGKPMPGWRPRRFHSARARTDARVKHRVREQRPEQRDREIKST